MRTPVAAIRGHLMWTRSGVVWATWRLAGLAKGFGDSDSNRQALMAHRALIQNVIGEGLLLGLTADLDPEVIVNKMLAGVDIEQYPGWAEEGLLMLDELEARPLGKREFWLAVPLRAGSWKNRGLAFARMCDTSLRDSLSLPVNPPSPIETAAARHAADQIEGAIPDVFEPRRASAAEQLWIAEHHQLRGLRVEQAAPSPTGSGKTNGAANYADVHAATARYTPPSVFPKPLLDEGGQSDGGSKLSRLDLFGRRFLKVQNPRENTASYQVMLALAGTPLGGWEPLAVDWMARIDELGVNADWAIRFTTTRGRDAKNRNKRAESNLTDQMDQQEGTAAITGSGGELDHVASDLNDFHQALGISEKEVEVQMTLIVAIAGSTPEEAQDKAQFLAKDFKGIEFIFDNALGAQEALWWAMHPGVPMSRPVREFTELTTGSNWASMIPLTSTDLGDDAGMPFADNITAGTPRPVMLDLWGQITGDVSGSVGVCAELGAGKSVLLKDVLGAVHDRGGRFVAIDRTQAREYGVFARSLDPKHTAIADLTEPEWSLDPLRVFGPRIGAGQMLTLCSALLGVPARSPGGIMLADLLDPKTAVDAGLTSAGALLAHLRELGKTDDSAKELAGLMGLYSRNEYGAVLFDESLRPLDLNSRAIVFLTHGVSLPEKQEIENDNLFRELGVEKLFGRAMYALLTRIAREVCFTRPNELTVAAFDEVAHITASPQGSQELFTFIRDGRKHGAPVIVAGHDARDFGDDVMRGLIKNRVLMRQTDADLAAVNLNWFHRGLGDNPQMVQLLTEDVSPLGMDNKVAPERRGEGLFRDARGRMGKIRKTVSLRPARRAATLTTPGQREQELEVVS